ncbi:MAG: YfiT family bacillithiol transferase [Acidobacteriota bacterium]
MTDPSYPVGPFVMSPATPALLRQWSNEIAQGPAALRSAVTGLSEAQLDTPYRDGGWTVRQVVHHVADSHINAYVRMKFALADENPPVPGYDEAAWARLADYRLTPIDVSLRLLEALTERWSVLIASLTEADYARTYLHSHDGPTRLDYQLALYAWHGRHHVAHITALAARMNW